MTITLYLEVNGRIKDQNECDYVMKDNIASRWHRMYPGKKVNVFYILESKINYEQDNERKESTDSRNQPR